MSQTHPSARVDAMTPLLYVEDIDASTAFYCDKLGFHIAESWEPDGRLAWCRLIRGGAAVMLEQACDEDGPAEFRGCGVGFFFYCADANAVYAEFSNAGLQIDPPQTAFYGMNQLFLKDPDGYQLCFQNSTEPSTSADVE